MKYGIFGSLSLSEGRREEFVNILSEGIQNMPGCLSYDINLDLVDGDTIWIYELWESKKHHEDSLSLPAVQKAISRGRTMIKDFGKKIEFTPIIN